MAFHRVMADHGRGGRSDYSGKCPEGLIGCSGENIHFWKLRTSQCIHERAEIKTEDISEVCSLFEYIYPLIYVFIDRFSQAARGEKFSRSAPVADNDFDTFMEIFWSFNSGLLVSHAYKSRLSFIKRLWTSNSWFNASRASFSYIFFMAVLTAEYYEVYFPKHISTLQGRKKLGAKPWYAEM